MLDPLIYFDSSRHVFTIGIPMALFLAIGANLQLLRQQFERLQATGEKKKNEKKKRESEPIPTTSEEN